MNVSYDLPTEYGYHSRWVPVGSASLAELLWFAAVEDGGGGGDGELRPSLASLRALDDRRAKLAVVAWPRSASVQQAHHVATMAGEQLNEWLALLAVAGNRRTHVGAHGHGASFGWHVADVAVSESSTSNGGRESPVLPPFVAEAVTSAHASRCVRYETVMLGWMYAAACIDVGMGCLRLAQQSHRARDRATGVAALVRAHHTLRAVCVENLLSWSTRLSGAERAPPPPCDIECCQASMLICELVVHLDGVRRVHAMPSPVDVTTTTTSLLAEAPSATAPLDAEDDDDDDDDDGEEEARREQDTPRGRASGTTTTGEERSPLAIEDHARAVLITRMAMWTMSRCDVLESLLRTERGKDARAWRLETGRLRAWALCQALSGAADKLVRDRVGERAAAVDAVRLLDAASEFLRHTTSLPSSSSDGAVALSSSSSRSVDSTETPAGGVRASYLRAKMSLGVVRQQRDAATMRAIAVRASLAASLSEQRRRLLLKFEARSWKTPRAPPSSPSSNASAAASGIMGRLQSLMSTPASWWHWTPVRDDPRASLSALAAWDDADEGNLGAVRASMDPWSLIPACAREPLAPLSAHFHRTSPSWRMTTASSVATDGGDDADAPLRQACAEVLVHERVFNDRRSPVAGRRQPASSSERTTPTASPVAQRRSMADALRVRSP